MKTKILLASLLIMTMGLFALPVPAWDGNVSICFENDTGNKSTYLLYWVDHPLWKKWKRSLNLAGGELGPGKTTCIGHNYRKGIYDAFWRDMVEDRDLGDPLRIGPRRFTIPEDNVKVTIKRSGANPVILTKPPDKGHDLPDLKP